MSPYEDYSVILDIEHKSLSNTIFLLSMLVNITQILDTALNIELIDFLDIVATFLSTDTRLFGNKWTLAN